MGMIAQVHSEKSGLSYKILYEVLRTTKSSENHNWILPKSHSHCLPMQSHHHVGVGGHYILSPWLPYGGRGLQTPLALLLDVCVRCEYVHVGVCWVGERRRKRTRIEILQFCAATTWRNNTVWTVYFWTTSVTIIMLLVMLWLDYNSWCGMGSGHKTRLNMGIDK